MILRDDYEESHLCDTLPCAEQRTGLGPRAIRFNRNVGSGDEDGEGGGFSSLSHYRYSIDNLNLEIFRKNAYFW